MYCQRNLKKKLYPLVTKKGYTILKGGKALGVVKNMLNCCKEVVEKKNVGITLLEDEQAQFKNLCKEVKCFRLDQKILKKVRVSFYFE